MLDKQLFFFPLLDINATLAMYFCDAGSFCRRNVLGVAKLSVQARVSKATEEEDETENGSVKSSPDLR